MNEYPKGSLPYAQEELRKAQQEFWAAVKAAVEKSKALLWCMDKFTDLLIRLNERLKKVLRHP